MTPADYAYSLIAAGHTAQSAMLSTGLSAECIAAMTPKTRRRVEFNPVVMRAPIVQPVAVSRPAYGPPMPNKANRAKMIIARVAAENGLSVADIMSQYNYRHLSWPRQGAMLAVRRETGLPYPEIGRIFNRDHTTVIHGCQRARERERGE